MATQAGSLFVDLSLQDRMTGQLKQAKSGLASFGGSLQSIGADVTKLGLGFTALGGAVTGAFAVATKAAMSFESAFAGVIKTVDATDAQLEQLESTIRGMATDATNPLAGLDDAAVSLAKIMELGGQLGVPLESLEGFTQVIGELTLATDLTAESAAMMLAQFASVTGMSFDDFDRLGSTIVDLGNNMATTESTIVEFMQRLGGAASSFGFTQSQIAALSAAMASLGINAESGGTAMTTVLTEISGAVAAGESSLVDFAGVAGVTASDFATAWQTDPMQALSAFISGLGEMDAAARELALGDLGLDSIRVSDALRRMSNDTEGLANALGIAGVAWDENSALTNEAQKRFETTEAQMNLLKNTVNDLGIEVGAVFLPILRDLVDGIVPAVKGFTTWAEKNPGLVKGIAALAIGVTAVGVALTVVGGIMSAVGFVIASPFLLPIIAATAAVAAFAVAIETNFMGIRDAAEQYLGPVSDIIGGMVDLFGGAIESITEPVDVTVEPEVTVTEPQGDPISQQILTGLGIAEGYEAKIRIHMNTEIDPASQQEYYQKQKGFAKSLGEESEPVTIDFPVDLTPDEAAISISARDFGESIRMAMLNELTNVWIGLRGGSAEGIFGFVEGIFGDIKQLFVAKTELTNLFNDYVGMPFIEGLLGFNPDDAFATFMANIGTSISEIDMADVDAAMQTVGDSIIQAAINGINAAAPGLIASVKSALTFSISISFPSFSLPDNPLSLSGWATTLIPTITINGGGGGGGGGSASGNASGGSSGGGSNYHPPPIGTNAQGGRMSAGGWSLVGENGPELFRADNAGTVIPNHQLVNHSGGTSGGGGGGINIGVVHVHGVQDVQAMYDELARVARQRSGRLAA